jgi:hypothetical protein
MSSQVTTTCDVCGTVKKETNHWFRIVRNHTNGYSDTELSFTIAPANAEPGSYNYQDTCSDKCTLTLTQRWLDQQKESSLKKEEI